MYSGLKKMIIKNVIIIGLILLVAVVSTHYIYFKFKNETRVDVSSESLDITFHEKTGANIDITKANPVTDSVGLSLNAYTFTVKNNLTEPVNYQIRLEKNIKTIIEDDCKEYLIGEDYIKVAIKEEGKENKIYTMTELEDNPLLETRIKALDEKEYSIRVWVDKDITVPTGSNLHYHGTIKVIEE